MTEACSNVQPGTCALHKVEEHEPQDITKQLQNIHDKTREGVYAPVGPAFLAHTKQKVTNIVDLTVLRLAFFMGYE